MHTTMLGRVELEDAPVFEVRHRDGRHFRIWADGRVEGFDSPAIIINRIPAHTARAVAHQAA